MALWAPSDLVSSVNVDADELKMHRMDDQLPREAYFCHSFLQKLGAAPMKK